MTLSLSSSHLNRKVPWNKTFCIVIRFGRMDKLYPTGICLWFTGDLLLAACHLHVLW